MPFSFVRRSSALLGDVRRCYLVILFRDVVKGTTLLGQ